MRGIAWFVRIQATDITNQRIAARDAALAAQAAAEAAQAAAELAETNAETAETNAAASASSASTSASNASTSASNAATSATNASNSASSASTSATNASNSASSAATSATNAANSATLAASYTPSQTGNAGKYLTTNGTAASWASPTDVVFNAQTGTTYTLVASDLNKMVTLTNANAITLTVPNGVFTTGQQINLAQLGVGQVEVVSDGTTTINASPGKKIRAQYAIATLICTASNTFLLVGDITA